MDTQIEYKFHTTKELDREEHTFEVVLERYPDGRYYIYCPSLKAVEHGDIVKKP